MKHVITPDRTLKRIRANLAEITRMAEHPDSTIPQAVFDLTQDSLVALDQLDFVGVGCGCQRCGDADADS